VLTFAAGVPPEDSGASGGGGDELAGSGGVTLGGSTKGGLAGGIEGDAGFVRPAAVGRCSNCELANGIGETKGGDGAGPGGAAADRSAERTTASGDGLGARGDS